MNRRSPSSLADSPPVAPRVERSRELVDLLVELGQDRARRSGQSKPTRAARFCSLSARVSAGKPSGTSASTLVSPPSAGPAPRAPPPCAPPRRGRAPRRRATSSRRRRRAGGGAIILSAMPRGDAVEVEPALPRRPSGRSRRPAAAGRRARREGRPVLALDRVGDLVGLLDRVGRDRGEGLLDVPGAAALGIAQPRASPPAAGRSRARLAHSRLPCSPRGRRPRRAAARRVGTAHRRARRRRTSISSSVSLPSAARLGTTWPALRPRTMA